MKTTQYVKIVIDVMNREGKYNNYKDKLNDYNNTMYISQQNVYPGTVYRLRGILLLCTCYEVDDKYNATIYFFTLLDNLIKKEISKRKINPLSLELYSTAESEENYKKMLSIYNANCSDYLKN